MLSRFFEDDLYHDLHAMNRYMQRDFERNFYRPLSLLNRFDRAIERELAPWDNFGYSRGFGRQLAPWSGFSPLTDFEREFDRTVALIDNIKKKAISEPDPNTHVYLKKYVNNNGKVWAKTMKKEPGKEWKIEEHNYEQTQALKDGQQNQQTQALKAEQQNPQTQEYIKDKDSVQIEDEKKEQLESSLKA